MGVNDVDPEFRRAISRYPEVSGNRARSIPDAGNRGLQQLHYMASLIFVYK